MSKAALVAAGVCAGLLLCEAWARLLLWRQYREALREGFAPEQAVAAPEDSWTRYDPLLGWSNIPGWSDPNDGRAPRIDAQGFRGDRDYAAPKPGGLKRIVLVGDSFTFGAEAADEETFAAHLQRLLGKKAEVANLGVTAYGLDQMVLRFERDGAPLSPDLVVAGLILDDLARCELAVWHTGHAKPRFALRDGELELLNVPTPRRVPAGRWTRPPEPTLRSVLRLSPVLPGFVAGRRPLSMAAAEPDELSELHKALLLRLRDDARRAGAAFAILLMGWWTQVDSPPPLRERLLEFCAASNIPVIDSYPAFRGKGFRLVRSHPTAVGHQVIAKLLYQELIKGGLIDWSGAPPPDLSKLDPRVSWLGGREPHPGPTLSQLKILTREHPERGALWIVRAKLSLESGDKKDAAESIARWRGEGAPDAEVREAATVYQDLGGCPKALALLDGLTRRAPKDARALIDRAVCRFKLGRSREAADDLERALALEPSRLEAYVSLGAVYEALGRREDGVRVYDRALALRAPRGAAGLRALIEKDRRRLAGP